MIITTAQNLVLQPVLYRCSQLLVQELRELLFDASSACYQPTPEDPGWAGPNLAELFFHPYLLFVNFKIFGENKILIFENFIFETVSDLNLFKF
jgi:hypothetical protein